MYILYVRDCTEFSEESMPLNVSHNVNLLWKRAEEYLEEMGGGRWINEAVNPCNGVGWKRTSTLRFSVGLIGEV